MASLGNAPGLIISAGVGAAAATAIEPVFEVPRQEAWSGLPNRILPLTSIARLVAQGGIELGNPLDIKPGTAYDEALRQGFSPDRLDREIYSTQTSPGVADLLFLWRLGIIDEDTWRFGMTKLGFRADFTASLAKTFTVPLTAADVAVMVQRSVVPNQGQLPGFQAPGPGKVPRYPVVDLDAYASARAYGVDEAQLDALTRIVGLPASPDLAARLVYRNIIDRTDFDLAIQQGNTRVEWTDPLFEGFREILTSHDAAELQLRGYLSRDERLGYTRNHGLADVDSDQLYNLLGRSIPVHQITTGEARGGTFEGPTDTIPKAYLQSLERGNLRPEYYSLAYANRYSYPSAFFFRLLLQQGEMTADEAYDAFLQIGWEPTFARKIADALAVTAKPVGDPHVTKAQSQLWTTTHRSYVGEMSGAADARARFTTLGIPATAQSDILALWDAERSLIRKQLSPAQIVKAVHNQVTNPATGLAWTQTDALTALEDRGYTRDDALTLLAE